MNRFCYLVICASLALLSACSSTKVMKLGRGSPDPGMVGHWKLNGNALDSSGHDRHGLISGATPGDGKFGGGYHFDGNAGIQLGAMDFATGAFTISGWVKTTNPGAPADQRAWISNNDNATGSASFDLVIHDGSTGAINGAGFCIWKSGYTPVNLMREGNLRDGKWHMVTATYQKDLQKLYVDGRLQAESDFAGVLPIVTTPVVIGGVHFGGHHPWIGEIDEVTIYDYPRSEGEVLEDYQGLLRDGAEPK